MGAEGLDPGDYWSGGSWDIAALLEDVAQQRIELAEVAGDVTVTAAGDGLEDDASSRMSMSPPRVLEESRRGVLEDDGDEIDAALDAALDAESAVRSDPYGDFA